MVLCRYPAPCWLNYCATNLGIHSLTAGSLIYHSQSYHFGVSSRPRAAGASLPPRPSLSAPPQLCGTAPQLLHSHHAAFTRRGSK